jgi:hypothetical protein
MEIGMFKTIIWATDGSRAAEQALPYAKGLAMAGRARLIVVHVDEFSVGKGGGYSIYVDEPETEAAIRRRVEELKREGLDASLQTSRVLMGGAAHVIADIAKQGASRSDRGRNAWSWSRGRTAAGQRYPPPGADRAVPSVGCPCKQLNDLDVRVLDQCSESPFESGHSNESKFSYEASQFSR